MRASGKPALCRTWLRTGPSRPCHTTSSCFTSNSKSPNNPLSILVWMSILCVSVCVCVCEQLRMQMKESSPLLHHVCVSLRKSLSYVRYHLNDLVGNRESVQLFIWHLYALRNGKTPKIAQHWEEWWWLSMSVIERISVWSQRRALVNLVIRQGQSRWIGDAVV